MGVKVITAATQPITTAELRAQCRIDDSNSDTMLDIYLGAAIGYAEHETQKSFGAQTLELALDEFPDGPIELPQGQVLSITSVKYIDTSNVERTLSASAYTTDDYNSIVQWLIEAVDTEWPDTADVANAVKVRYVAGNLPASVRSALLMHVCWLNDNREGGEQPFPKRAIDMLLETVKRWGR